MVRHRIFIGPGKRIRRNLLIYQSITEWRRNYPHSRRHILGRNTSRGESIGAVPASGPRGVSVASAVFSGSGTEGGEWIWWGFIWRRFTRCGVLGLLALLRLLSLARRQGCDVGDGQFSDIGGAIAAHAQVLKFCTGRAIREVDRHPAGANIGDRILAVAAYAGGGTCRGANGHRVATSVGQDNAVLVTDARGANEGEFR